MRLEIVIPDSTRPDIKAMLAALTKRPSLHPEWLEEIHLIGNSREEIAQKLFTPERLERISQAEYSIAGGKGMTMEQVSRGIEETKAAWLRANS